MMRYTFLGDRWTRPELCGMQCDPVRDSRGKCIVSMKMATALVIDAGGRLHVVPRRRLRVNGAAKPDSDLRPLCGHKQDAVDGRFPIRLRT